MKQLVVFAFAIGCTAYPTYKPNVPIECEVEAQYTLKPINDFEVLSPPDPGWTAVDGSLGSTMAGMVVAIPEGTRCNDLPTRSSAALRITANNNNDWGSLFGLNNFATQNGAAFEGMSFWARAGYNSNTAFTILLDDPNTNNPNQPARCEADAGVPTSMGAGNACTNYCNDGGTGTGTTDGTGMIIPGTVGVAPEPDQCGNSYTAVRAVTPWWRFYTIPFSDFQQLAAPNRVPNKELALTGPLPDTGLRTSDLLNLIIRLPKAMPTELWIDNLGFYRKATATGGDGGVDAPQM